MRQKIIALILIIIPFALQAEQSDKHFMWEIRSETGLVYLLGSAHIAKKELYPLDSVIENAFKRSGYLVVELDINSLDPSFLTDKIMIPGDTTLEDILEPELYERLKKEFNEYKVPSSMFKRYKPWFAVLYLGQIELMNEGYDPNSGIDKYFLDKAGDRQIIALETPEQQMKVFEELDKMPNDFVEYSLNELDSSIYHMDQMIKAWSSGDTTTIKDKVIESMSEDMELEHISEVMLDKRNYIMAEKIKEYLQDDNIYFVIVGAAHIPGDNGILSILRRGNKYRIEQK